MVGRRKRLPHNYGGKGSCGIFNTNQNFLNRFLLGNGDFDVNVWNRGVYTSK